VPSVRAFLLVCHLNAGRQDLALLVILLPDWWFVPLDAIMRSTLGEKAYPAPEI
jgi:hypothetical protein